MRKLVGETLADQAVAASPLLLHARLKVPPTGARVPVRPPGVQVICGGVPTCAQPELAEVPLLPEFPVVNPVVLPALPLPPDAELGPSSRGCLESPTPQPPSIRAIGSRRSGRIGLAYVEPRSCRKGGWRTAGESEEVG